MTRQWRAGSMTFPSHYHAFDYLVRVGPLLRNPDVVPFLRGGLWTLIVELDAAYVPGLADTDDDLHWC